jgi:hypothetical protein
MVENDCHASPLVVHVVIIRDTVISHVFDIMGAKKKTDLSVSQNNSD